MSIPTTGQVKMSDMRSLMGVSGQISLNSAAGAFDVDKAGGAKFSEFRGKGVFRQTNVMTIGWEVKDRGYLITNGMGDLSPNTIYLASGQTALIPKLSTNIDNPGQVTIIINQNHGVDTSIHLELQGSGGEILATFAWAVPGFTKTFTFLNTDVYDYIHNNVGGQIIIYDKNRPA